MKQTNETKERPILFSGEMVRAILEGRKTQTRRIVKPALRNDTEMRFFQDEQPTYLCPYGKAGDLLWVRETWAEICYNECGCDGGECLDHGFVYKADTPNDKYPGEWPNEFLPEEVPCRWRPSIHMPRSASRILLEITDVRVERLQDISEEDAKAEGVEWMHSLLEPTESFSELWQSINGSESWANNPFVWAITFKRIQP